MIDPDNPPEEVKKWMKRLHKCLKDAPPGIWLYAASAGLYVMANGKDGDVVMKEFAVDPDYEIKDVAAGTRICIDGGDW